MEEIKKYSDNVRVGHERIVELDAFTSSVESVKVNRSMVAV